MRGRRDRPAAIDPEGGVGADRDLQQGRQTRDRAREHFRLHRQRGQAESGAEQAPASRRWMLQQRHDELPVAIERGRSSDNRHQPVGVRQIEQPIDVVIAQPLRDASEHELPAHSDPNPLSPERVWYAASASLPSASRDNAAEDSTSPAIRALKRL